jgi:hypothetical protein
MQETPQRITPAGVGRRNSAVTLLLTQSIVMKSQHRPDPFNKFDIDRSEGMTRENKELLAKINSESILKAPTVKGSIYFYIDTHGDGDSSKEELIDDPSALDPASNELGIEIRYENKHHRWIANMPQALKILEFVATHLKQKNNQFSVDFGINAELRWQDEKDIENIIHITQSKGNADWKVSRYC